ncbi:MAG: AAA family ATPase [Promethearchaeota archaeon]
MQTGQNVVFQELFLENFMAHQSTHITFRDKPIIVVTGANGSGKTQIIDALMLCLGLTPPRAKKGLSKLIRKDQEKAVLRLILNNPKVDSGYLFSSLDSALQKLESEVLCPKIEIQATIAKNRVKYALNGRSTINGVNITRELIRKLLKTFYVETNNDLAFTQEGTVDGFAQESAREKLHTLLESLNMDETYAELLQGQSLILDRIKEIRPLQEQLQLEEKRLQHFLDALKLLKEKEKLFIQKQNLELEAAWSPVILHQENKETLMSSLDMKLSSKFIQSLLLRELYNNKSQLSEEKAKLDQLFDEIKQEKEKGLRNLGELRGELRTHQSQKKTLSQKVERLMQERETFEQTFLEVSPREQLQQKNELLDQEEAKLERVNARLKEFETEIKEIEDELFQLDDEEKEPSLQQAMTRHEREYLETAREFKRHLINNRLIDKVIGPAVEFLEIHPAHTDAESAVKRIIGTDLYAFFALTRESYQKSKTLYDAIWKRQKPPIKVIRVDWDTIETVPLPTPSDVPGIRGRALSLVQGDSIIIKSLLVSSKGYISENKQDANYLTDFAKENRVGVLSVDCKSYYIAQGGFSRPPPPFVIPFGKIDEDFVGSLMTPQQLKKQLTAKRSQQRQKSKERTQLIASIGQLKEEINTLSLDEQQIQNKYDIIQKNIEDTEEALEEKTDQCDELTEEVKVIEAQIEELENQIQGIEDRNSPLSLEIQQLLAEEARLEHQLAELDKEIPPLEEKILEEEKEILALSDIAQKLGDCPPAVRELGEIREELAQIRGKLDVIQITDADETKCQEQEKKVADLKKYLEEREEHLENLRLDLDERLTSWHDTLQRILNQSTGAMNFLLEGYMNEIRLRFTQPNKIEEGGLLIEVRHFDGAQWIPYGELSGGEKVLLRLALVLSLHSLTESAIHAIDEFTQRLDDTNKLRAFNMVRKMISKSTEDANDHAFFILVCPHIKGIELSDDIQHLIFCQAEIQDKNDN